jgi:hypothetical protein
MSQFTGSIVEDAALAWLTIPRDTLLPTLISGELRMKEAERVIKEATV